MKSQHRHELKTNELADWIAHFPEWAKENARVIAGTVAVLVVALGLYGWNRYNQSVLGPRRQLQLTHLMSQVDVAKRSVLQGRAEGQRTLQQSADNLEVFAQGVSGTPMAATAYLQRAKALRAALHYQTGEISPETRQAQLLKAKESYTLALENAGDVASLRAAARYGLGLCAEELAEYAEARTIYTEMIADTTLAGTAAQVAAEQRLGVMDEFVAPVTFRPAPPPAEPPTPADAPVLDLSVPQIVAAPNEATDANASGL